MSEDFGGWLSVILLVTFVFSLFIVSAILRIRNSLRMLRDPGSTHLTRVLRKLAICMDAIILIWAIIILLIVIFHILFECESFRSARVSSTQTAVPHRLLIG
jgi:hypothetical protein